VNVSSDRKVLEYVHPLALWKSWVAENAREREHSRTLTRTCGVVPGIEARMM